MRNRDCIGFALALLGTFSFAWAGTPPNTAPPPLEVRPGVWMIPGGILPGHEPDGNSVIFDAPAGLIVVDTGRHQWHREAILSFARMHKKRIIAIVNTHWHLDHVSGNPALRAAYPGLRVYASDAIDSALTGFLASSAKEEAGYLDDPQFPRELREDIRGDLLTIQNGAALKPDNVISASGSMTLGGRVLRINLAPNAATAGDVWLYDHKIRVAALGDLVTLPAPFLDTACPDGWKLALAQVAATPFEIAIPGHGAPMSHAQVLLYRQEFEALIDCSNSPAPKEECARRWADSIRPLLGSSSAERQRAQETAAYYIDMLRANGGRSKYCEAPAPP
ncbi:MAG TPA: MBL fold metallo-hydrolase [Steroidobacteraceae bacterium]|jgi:glyoxylase-like metal-dependent hydrolase (beta-lactamase superfamily II)|nr:MBL fold metallo-hydrolase [Steroidobacteraceae bacterium]